MKVKDLIALLEPADPEMEVLYEHPDIEGPCGTVEGVYVALDPRGGKTVLVLTV